MVTPLGILAVGSAWGEWSPVDFAKLETRAQIAAVSGDQVLPDAVPSGLRKLSSIWTAPFPDYAPAFVRSPHLGYLLSAMFGVGLFGVLSLIAGAVAKKRNAPRVGFMSRHFFIESTLRGFARALSRALASEQLVTRRGLLQAFDPRVRAGGDCFAGCGHHGQQALSVIAFYSPRPC